MRGTYELSVSPLTVYVSFERVSRLSIHSGSVCGKEGPFLGCLPVVLLQHCSVCLGNVVLKTHLRLYDHPVTCSGSQSVQSG